MSALIIRLVTVVRAMALRRNGCLESSWKPSAISRSRCRPARLLTPPAISRIACSCGRPLLRPVLPALPAPPAATLSGERRARKNSAAFTAKDIACMTPKSHPPSGLPASTARCEIVSLLAITMETCSFGTREEISAVSASE
ncbi:hypothetical protein GCM10022252_70950 [Streptosporangium oxazolinicum]|uniref:Secreted protein n=1 Tax=Streptosporangium oxazolinicum TaxID=909287 RepID=A0ABP8BI31_9ACTN